MAKSDNKEREQRILDAAAELFIHYGYDKTAVSEIAQKAGVSQGGIYLHFDSKEQLLEALILRELQIYSKRWLGLVDADPKGGTLTGMYKNSLVALDSSVFMTAMFKQDGRVFGSYLRKEDNILRKRGQSNRYTFVKMMQEAGAIRNDMDPKVIAHIMNIMAYGLVAMDEVLDREDIPPAEDVIDGISIFMETTLTPKDGGNEEAGKAIIKQISEATLKAFEELDE